MTEQILPFEDRVKQVCTGTGTSTLTLSTVPSGFRSFSSAYPDASGASQYRFYYTIATANSTEWEIGIGYHSSSGLSLNRETVIRSSNSDALVNFSAGNKDVFSTPPARFINAIPTIGQVVAIVSSGGV